MVFIRQYNFNVKLDILFNLIKFIGSRSWLSANQIKKAVKLRPKNSYTIIKVRNS
jgi:hypothetical protein